MKKGFTLIELLAVIVILAIIAVIAVPIVIDIIDDSKENASLRSADNYLHALEFEIANKGLNNEKYEDGVYSIDEFDIEIKGEAPTSGFVQIINGEIDKYSLIISGNQADSNEEYSVWNGETSTAMTADKNGDYHITKASELYWLAQSVNAGNTYEGYNFYLENNLDLNNIEWTPIGTPTTKFMGNFYGNNNVIKNIHINNELTAQGLFGDITGIVDGLIIKDFNIVGQIGVGTLTGVSRESAKINNITIYNSKVKSIENAAGGIIGQFQGVGNNLKVINTHIEAASVVGGIIGKTTSSGTKIKELRNCYIDSNTYIYAFGLKDNKLGYDIGNAGGISGRGYTLIIDNSLSYATVESSETHVGGIIGSANTSSIIKNTRMYGKVKGKKFIGGIAGLVESGTISSCEVSGNISAEESSKLGIIAGVSYSSQITENVVYLNDMQITGDYLIGSDSSDTTLTDNIIK